MSIQKLAILFCLSIFSLITIYSSADATRPTAPKPQFCEKFFHSNVAKAKKLSRAKRRARRKFNRALRGFGMQFGGWPTWARSKHRHYDCHKKKKWYHCRAAAYPC